MSKKDRSLANSRDEAKKIYYQRKEINRLQQENQQLKEDYDCAFQDAEELNQRLTEVIDEKNNLLSVLDEIRECTRKYCSGIFTDDGEIVFVTPTANIVQILDKVKE